MTDKPSTELEGVLAEKEMRLEAVRIEHEDQIVVIKEQKAEKLRQIETEEAVQLEILRQSREDCALEGDGRAETCREEHDRILDDIRTERDTQLEAVRVQSGEAQLEAIAEAKEELVLGQAQLEQQLKNIREQRFDEIEKIMRKCEDGGEKKDEKACKMLEEVCPAIREQSFDEITALCAEEAQEGKY